MRRSSLKSSPWSGEIMVDGMSAILRRSANAAAACIPASPASAKMVTRRIPSGHCQSRRLPADNAAQVGKPKMVQADNAVSMPSAIPICPSAGIGARRTEPPATGPSIFLPGGAFAEPSSSRKVRWMPPMGLPAASRTMATSPGQPRRLSKSARSSWNRRSGEPGSPTPRARR